MTYDLIPALITFAFVSSITPGPNNLMLMSSGANYGFRRSVPHMMGVCIGFTVMVALVGLGLMQLFERLPASYTILTAFSVVYLLWLAWKIAHAKGPDKAQTNGRPMSFIQAALFQWVNPKAWTMALTAITIYAPSQSLTAVLGVALIFGAVNLPSISSWTLLGQQMQRLLARPGRLRAFNITMALLLVGSIAPVVLGAA